MRAGKNIRVRPRKKTALRKAWVHFRGSLSELADRGLLDLLFNTALFWGMLYMCGAGISAWQSYLFCLVIAVFMAENRTFLVMSAIRQGLTLDFLIFFMASLAQRHTSLFQL